MAGIRFTVKGALAGVLVLALLLAVLISNVEWVGNLAFAAFFGLLALALVGALVGRGNTRVFWLGCAVFGAVYAYYLFGEWRALTDYAELPTTRMLDWLARFHLRPHVGMRCNAEVTPNTIWPATLTDYDPQSGKYLAQPYSYMASQVPPPPGWVLPSQVIVDTGMAVHSGHAALGLLAALAGGVVSLWCFGERPPRPAALAVTARSDAA